jgi:hypothetical protein
MKDRELALIGGGAFLTVLCLLLPWPFTLRVGTGMALLVFFTAFALWPVGPEHLTVEQALFRFVRRARRPKKYTLTSDRGDQPLAPRGTLISAPPLPSPGAGHEPDPSDFDYPPGPIAWNEADYHLAVLIWLGVIGLYFIYWIARGGSVEIGQWLGTFLPGRIP